MFTRSLIATLLLSTCAAWADDFRATAPVTAATVFPQGASVTREVSIDLPAGSHRILFPIAPDALQEGPPRLTAQGGLQIGAVEVLRGQISDPKEVYSPEQAAAWDAFQAASDAVVARQDEIRSAQTELSEALAATEFLKSIKGQALTGLDAEALQATALMIGTQIGQAETKSRDVERRIREAQKAEQQAQAALAQAQADFQRLYPPSGRIDMLAVSVTLAEPQEVTLNLEHLVYQAGWSPHYDLRLTTESGAISGERKAVVYQATNERWTDVALTLSTANPFSSTAPQEPFPSLARIDRNDLRLKRSVSAPPPPPAAGSLSRLADTEVVLEEPVFEEFAGPVVDSVAVTYSYPADVTLVPANPRDGLQLTLGGFDLESELAAIAAPRTDKTAFMVAKLRNTLLDPILPGTAALYRDDAFVGRTQLDYIPAGAEAKIPFGAIDGIRLDFKILDNDTGDAGVVSRSNVREQQMEFTVENLSADSETVTALFALPFSEQEDLDIRVTAVPAPTSEDYEKKRGVGAWELALAPGAKITVRVNVGFGWPTDQQLYWSP